MILFTRRVRTLLLAAVTVIGAVWLPGRGGAFAGDYFFPTKKGLAHVTAFKDGDGNVLKYMRETIMDVTGAGDNWAVVYRIETLDKNRRRDTEIPATESTIRIVDGAIVTDMRTALMPLLGIPEGSGIEWTFSGDTLISIPARIKPGDRLKDVNMTIKRRMGYDKMTIKSSTTGRICLALENVTVPAGTFKAYKLTEATTLVMSLPEGEVAQKVTTVTWAVLGVGTAKAVVTDEKGKVQSIVELQEIVR
jgi:hypothetical protein